VAAAFFVFVITFVGVAVHIMTKTSGRALQKSALSAMAITVLAMADSKETVSQAKTFLFLIDLNRLHLKDVVWSAEQRRQLIILATATTLQEWRQTPRCSQGRPPVTYDAARGGVIREGLN